jgi:branched-subunit amino acid transport protein
VGALAAVVLPEIVLNNGQLINSWRDARLWGALVGTAWFCWRRGMLGTIVSGTATMLVLRLGLGW